MLSKRPRPIIGKISELLISGRGSSEFATSPRSPLDLVKMQSPRGLKSYGAGGIGLGIVAALEKSSEPKYTICSQSLARSNPVPAKTRRGFVEVDPDEEGFEDYTVVTCRGPDRSFTKVYHGGVVEYGSGYETETMIGKKGVESEERDLYPSSSYLSSCHMCRKNLDGQDIYMYRGEKAFCSNECRSSQILMDERKEKCRSEASRSADVSSSPYTRGQIFSTGIAAV